VRCASPAMTSLYQQMRPLVGNDLPVLIVGETGVGKEHLAQTLHRSSPRGRGPLVAINCAAIPAELLEAELFGIGDRVATGVAARRGRFQQADGGTLFLDEIGEMPRNLQAKLLRALDEKHVHPVGAGPVPVDVRVLSATNVDLYRRMEVGQIRRDLFFRLAGYLLEVPPLRSRPEDVPLLAEHFLNRFSREANKRIRGLTVRAMNALAAYEWPGNVRELEHEMRRLVYLCPKGQAIEAGMLADHFRRGEAADSTAASQGAEEDEESAEAAGEPRLPTLNLEQLDLLAIEQAMARSGGRVAEAARSLGISRYTLRRRLQRSGIQD
ncbi:MAG TPA: sigma-54 dependent transcriptional regulator, partial [Nitrospiraceae bacterium]